MQLHRGGFSQSTAGVTPTPATFSGLPRAAVPPAGKGAPGLRAAVASPDADSSSTLDLPTSTCFAPFLLLNSQFPQQNLDPAGWDKGSTYDAYTIPAEAS